ncbi:hypothetical protein E6W36_15885 [Hankyongella ginsenosidimutans]|uniref:Uncharacterized protein n=1 Tax=Hankyongella ginsenosidimutans TaxID=1763828 RepID=A0A4D7CBI6_9SPHN|nr:hypothetical protein [Hankyongella ginsenosidimutans]QCI78622.1 hypothetical protein E6W36_00210 [Hankyongella ginsenosidimutans]QCI80453.1 hypothetical protein E6W36_15885 [Hankyongella ginsenosidimutans]TXG85155.1 MAG: hypothetical protein E6R12_02375 [Sphingomonadales bacterium]
MIRTLALTFLLLAPSLASADSPPDPAAGVAAKPQKQHSARVQRKLDYLASLTPDGEPKDCLPITQVESTRVLSDSAILFKMRGGKLYLSKLPYACPRLGFEERFSFKTSTPYYCSIDVITPLDNRLQEFGSCPLGVFQPVKPAPKS